MKRFALASLLLAASLVGTGCHSCHSPYDYSSPVADCQCDGCGGGRAGSALSGGYSTGPPEYVETVPQYDESYGDSYIEQGPVMMESITE